MSRILRGYGLMFEITRTLHITLAVLTVFSFSLRGIWMLCGSVLLQSKAARILPHVIDTFLLLSGIFLAANYAGSLLQQHWLMAKLVAVILYILTGSIALKYGKTRGIRITALILSWCLLALVVRLAMTRSLTLGF